MTVMSLAIVLEEVVRVVCAYVVHKAKNRWKEDVLREWFTHLTT